MYIRTAIAKTTVEKFIASNPESFLVLGAKSKRVVGMASVIEDALRIAEEMSELKNREYVVAVAG